MQQFEAVFISDLHLHPEMPEITERYRDFLAWAQTRTKALYILGDFFHVWAGDDTQTTWSHSILDALRQLNDVGVSIFFMPGNRDFLLTARYLQRFHIQFLSKPTVIRLGQQSVLLAHGDEYCTQDKPHQYFRILTRNHWFSSFFLRIPKWIRVRITDGVRNQSEIKHHKHPKLVETIPKAWIHALCKHQAQIVIHGHTHIPKHEVYCIDENRYDQYILSDWDKAPKLLGFDKSEGFIFIQK